ncbi:helix-turn-helix domain-containing protein [Sulfuriferula plumbiphila]|nr:helix-turn-helix domain-containing protein [Sulfuriferula plumbiphila]
MKNSTTSKKRKAKAAACPSNRTSWAYWMQAIEPKSEAINRAFPGYHPLWVMQSQRMNVTPEHFLWLRKHLLNITQHQAAAYLRVSVATVSAWENGTESLPFMAFELLRLVYESTANRLSHAQWDGWFIGKDGGFVCPDVGSLSITPQDFGALQYTKAELETHRAENNRLRAAIAAQIAENNSLRELFVNQGMVDELENIRDRIGELFGQLNTAKIFQIKPSRKAA